MANKHLRRNLWHKTSDANIWWREESAGIVIGGGGSSRTVLIRWSGIRAAIRRKDKPLRRQEVTHDQ